MDAIVTKELQLRTDEIVEIRQQLYQAQNTLLDRVEALEARKGALVLGGTIDGKNAEMREAQMQQQAGAEIFAVRDAERDVKKWQSYFDVCVYRLDAVKYHIRLLEATRA